MKKQILLSFYLMMTTGALANAAGSCNFHPEDPYSPAAVQTEGKYQGRCLDTTVKRAVQVLSQSAQEMTVANFHKGNSFYVAHIPLNGITKVSYIVVDLNARPANFGGIVNVAHTELRLQIDKNTPIRLEPQGTITETPATEETDVMVSFNYMAPPGVVYDPLAGFNAKLYGSALRFFSTADEVKSRFVTSKINMYEIPLNVAPAPAGQMLAYALNLSQKIQYGAGYDTWSNNCTTQIFDILDAGLDLQNQKPYRFQIGHINDAGMIPAFLALGQRGLVSNQTQILLLNTEFGRPLFPSGGNRYFDKDWVGRNLEEAKAQESF